MPKRITMIGLPLGTLFSRLVGNLMIVVLLVTTAFGLTQFDALAAAAECGTRIQRPARLWRDCPLRGDSSVAA